MQAIIFLLVQLLAMIAVVTGHLLATDQLHTGLLHYIVLGLAPAAGFGLGVIFEKLNAL